MKKNFLKKSNLVKYLSLLAAVLSFVALIMIFVPAIKSGDSSYNGWQVAFGYTSTSGGSWGSINVQTSTVVFKFSFMNFLSYVLVLAALVISVLAAVAHNKWFNVAVVVLAVCSGIFLLLTKNFCVLGDGLKKIYDAAGTSFASSSNVSLGAGPIVASVFMFITAACAGTSTVLTFAK